MNPIGEVAAIAVRPLLDMVIAAFCTAAAGALGVLVIAKADTPLSRAATEWWNSI